MNKEQRTKDAFTLIELVAAVGILAMVILFAGAIFKVSIGSHRTAIANAEIMQKLRVITDQMNADFKGVMSTAYGKAAFGESAPGVRSDTIAFLADGDFQSTGPYSNKTVVGNLASILYGLANTLTLNPRDRILVRRQTILTYDSSVPVIDPINLDEEYFTKSLSEWKATPPFADPNLWLQKPTIDPNSLQLRDLVMYMAKGVDNFTVQFAKWDDAAKMYIWVPRGPFEFGAYANASIATNAFKFTFTLYDSKGVIKNGRIFTHIVYLGS